ncbi:hypothetical protein ASE01_00870 [Nocardioides sp. Root190]|uniref:Cap15 family cyclic dinucleotide receptor domain-containing protein n=1 Tax=Nocardioides sp. Root190 TaxID=1736488 RepID=UPI0006FD24E1|nr:hypothetical protein [Nocardioides sp. Root190]KRB80091.1 hypothetical protein ASE01_00870 [Nocardioides sp. Root190]
MTTIKNSVRITALAISAIYTGVLFLSEVELDTWAKRIIAALPTIAAFAVVAYDRWLWKLGPALQLHQTPHLGGLWKATLTPHQDSHIPEGGNRGPIDAFVVVEQTFWSVSVALFTVESKSYSRTSTFIKHGESSQRSLSFLYDNEPRIEHRVRSPRHVGACEISTPRGEPTRLQGYYFTDRLTKGELVLEFVDRTSNHSDFASAQAHCQTLP